MKPDRSNYEIWLIDWLDGNLDAVRTEQLMAFLDENPDIREEADSLSATRLEPGKNASPLKKRLKKTVSDLPLSQVEYLSVAYLENDLSDEQIKDLKENISKNPENRRLFESIQKTKLKPQKYNFRNKRNLLKKTPAERVIRLSVIGLSAAAAIILLVVTFLTLPRSIKTQNESLAVNSYRDTLVIQAGRVITVKEDIVYTESTPAGKSGPAIILTDISEPDDQSPAYIRADTVSFPVRDPDVYISAVPVTSSFGISHPETGYPALVALNIVTREPSYYDPDRGRIKRFFASTFREKILKDKVYNDAPLQPYEIAEAGIEGLNRLLGWEMALVKTSDEEGELQSYYFSSRVLKFNAPVKKSNPSL
jgi:hypothetical protein